MSSEFQGFEGLARRIWWKGWVWGFVLGMAFGALMDRS